MKKYLLILQHLCGRIFLIIQERKEDFNLVLIRYAQERLLYRLSKSEYADDFVLKGGLMFLVRDDNSYRPTRDMDLLGYGSSSSMLEVFKSLSSTNSPMDWCLI